MCNLDKNCNQTGEHPHTGTSYMSYATEESILEGLAEWRAKRKLTIVGLLATAAIIIEIIVLFSVLTS